MTSVSSAYACMEASAIGWRTELKLMFHSNGPNTEPYRQLRFIVIMDEQYVIVLLLK